MSYIHGITATLGATQHAQPAASGTVPVYIGCAPAHLAAHPAPVNTPVLIRNYAEAVDMLGMAWDFDKYDLAEAVYAHFGGRTAIGPIVAINVLDPDSARADEQQTQSLTLINGSGSFVDADCILSTVAIADKTQGVDFAVSFSYSTGRVTVTDLTGELSTPQEVTYSRVDTSKLTSAAVIGQAGDGTPPTGIKAIDLVYPRLGLVPSMACALKWGCDKDVHTALVAAAASASTKFPVLVVANLPCDGTTATISDAISVKGSLGMTQDSTVVCWPLVSVSGRLVHAAARWITRQMLIDNANDGLPYESASNKILDDVDGIYSSPGTEAILTLDSANKMNAAGITTVLCWGGAWRLWGSHTAAYNADGEYDARAVFASNMRMLYYLCNQITLRYWDVIDQPMTRNNREALVTSIQGWLDGLVSAGALCYAKCAVDTGADALNTDLVRFTIHLSAAVTSVPPLQALSVQVSYTDAGLDLLFE